MSFLVIYSIVPPEVIFSANKENGRENFLEMNYKGERVFVSKHHGNEYTIERIISTSPMAYLDPEIQPGTIIKGLI